MVAITDARDELADLVNRAAYGHERVILTRHGKPIAAIISADELTYFERLEDLDDVRAAKEAMAEPAPNVLADEAFRDLGE